MAQNRKVNWQPAGFTFSIWGVIYIFGTVLWILLLTHQMKPFGYESSYLLILMSCVLNPLWIFCWIKKYTVYANVVLILLAAVLIAVFLSEWSKSNILMLNFIGSYATWASAASLLNTQINIGNGPWIKCACLSVLIVVQVTAVLSVALRGDTQEHATTLVGILITALWISIGILYKHIEDIVVQIYFFLNLSVYISFFVWYAVTF
jgi:tryptophan-rich sensory protein